MIGTPVRVLFVCTGNICRSPLAEALFRHYVREERLEDQFVIDSAGLDSWHVGENADPRTCQIGRAYGIDVDSVARQFEAADFERFDLILAMDRGHFRALTARAPARHREKVKLMREYDDPEHQSKDVPDPYYGGAEGFESMYRMLSVCCRHLLESLRK
jgi:low molecular weight protein-tyrosine phosphatase